MGNTKMIEIDFNKRRKDLADEIKKNGFSAYIVTRQAGLHYLCGIFMPWKGIALVTADGAFILFYWTNDTSRIITEGPVATKIIEYTDLDLYEKLRNKLLELGIFNGRLAVDLNVPGTAQPAPGILTASDYLQLLKFLPEYSIENGAFCLDKLLMIKSEAELERLKFAASIADYAYNRALELITVGMTENQVAGILEHASRNKGSYWSWSVTAGTEVGSGMRSAFSHGVTQIATDRKIQENEFIILDFHPCYDLYLCDFSVPVFIGKPNNQQKKLIDCWEEALNTVFYAIKPGVRICDAVAKGIVVYEKYGLSEYSLPRFGHGLGVCVRTGPILNLTNTDVFETGMTFAFGAHLYQPGVGGLRLEYPVSVGKTSAQRLSETEMKVHFINIS